MKDQLKKVWSEYGVLLVITSVVILLQTVVGVIIWDRLPETIATHFNVNNEPDGYSSRTFTVFGMPLMLLALHWICLLLSCSGNQKLASADPRVRRLCVYIIPAISLLMVGVTYGNALGIEMDVGRIVLVFLGALFLVLGNYMPKIRHNYTTGIKLPWTLADEEIWNKTHRMAGPVWMIGGLALIACSMFVGDIELAVAVLIMVILVPTVYSLATYMKKYKNK
ncbi:MAG: SdpI family protein [Clostridia bacterium]|nr:SdpI family protein [Clostridia bacterium]